MSNIEGIETTTTVDVNWWELGQWLAKSDSDAQAAFLDGLAEGLVSGLSVTEYARQVQWIATSGTGEDHQGLVYDFCTDLVRAIDPMDGDKA